MRMTTALIWFPLLLLPGCAPKGTASPPPEAPSNASSDTAAGAACTQIDGYFVLTAEEYASRHGSGVEKLSQFTTSLQRPLEGCGGLGVNLERLACDDGSQPFRDFEPGYEMHKGSAARGGRCGGEIALYEVRCPEATYVVYVDKHICGPEGPAARTTRRR